MKRKYEKTHPWISFSYNLGKISPSLWRKLGEATSKCEHLAGAPLDPAVAKRLHNVFLAKGIHATAAIEGNTLTEKQVQDIIEKTETVQKTQEYLETEIQNIIDAANDILGIVSEAENKKLTVEDIKRYNSYVLKNLDVDEHVIPGEISKVQVGVPNYRGAPPEDCEFLLKKLTDWFNSDDFKANSKEDTKWVGIIKSIIAHIYIAWIHPFGDGNGRTARLIEVRFLLEADIPSAAAHLLSNHYNKTRTQYYKELDRASKNGGDITPFIDYAINGFVDQLKEQIKTVRKQQWDAAWVNFVHSTFGERKSETDRRRVKLTIALSKNSPALRSEIVTLTPEIAILYARKTDRTLTRDLLELRELGLIERTPSGYRARTELILAFLPLSKPERIHEMLKEFDVREDRKNRRQHKIKLTPNEEDL